MSEVNDTDHTFASARAASAARLRAPSACILAPMIRRPQIVWRDLKLLDGTTAAMLEFVTNRQLRVDAGACFGSVCSIDRGLDGESAVLGRDGQADFHQVLAVVG